MQPHEWATLAIALYGAVLASYSAFRASQKDRRSLELQLSTAIKTYGGALGPTLLAITAVNVGHRRLVVDAPQLQVKGDNHVFSLLDADGLSDFPKRLDDGDSGTVRIGYREVAMALAQRGYSDTVQLMGICKDSAGRRYESKPWRVDISEWLRM